MATLGLNDQRDKAFCPQWQSLEIPYRKRDSGFAVLLHHEFLSGTNRFELPLPPSKKLEFFIARLSVCVHSTVCVTKNVSKSSLKV